MKNLNVYEAYEVFLIRRCFLENPTNGPTKPLYSRNLYGVSYVKYQNHGYKSSLNLKIQKHFSNFLELIKIKCLLKTS